MPLTVLAGVADDDCDMVRPAPDGRNLVWIGRDSQPERFTVRGSANIVPFLSSPRLAMDMFYIQRGAARTFRLGPGAIVNHIADPDLCSLALEDVAAIVRGTNKPCFNHPAYVERTTRDGVAKLLTGIPGLTVPKTLRMPPSCSIEEIRKTVEDEGLRYPILVRIAGSHGGNDRVRVDRDDAINEIRQLGHAYHALYVTEFHDFAGADGLYRKFRIAMVGDEIFLRHCIIGDHWSLKAQRRTAGTAAEESAVLEQFDRDWAPSIRPVFLEIARRIGLDYFGVDCSIDPERRVLLFEANACMKILANTRPSPNMWDAPIARIKQALEARLASPETWRHQP